MNKPQIAIVFDFGGVLVDWNSHYLYRKLLNGDDAAIDRFLTEIGFTEWNLHQDKGRSFAAGVAVLSAQFPQYADLIRAYDERWQESLSGPIPGTVEILRKLKDARYPLYGLSNWALEKFNLVRHQYEFFSLVRRHPDFQHGKSDQARSAHLHAVSRSYRLGRRRLRVRR